MVTSTPLPGSWLPMAVWPPSPSSLLISSSLSFSSWLITSMMVRFTSVIGTRSWGRFGPARLGTTSSRSSSSTSLNSGSGSSLERHRPWALQ